ncbi:hypothetical protein GOX01_17700 [Gluconobacter oxydans]|nr:hypothetical protein AD939_01385 [Gluconobacter oxydans]GEC61439.1 hypothetical protein GOX01_17700 [Gluconobacter oxydans]
MLLPLTPPSCNRQSIFRRIDRQNTPAMLRQRQSTDADRTSEFHRKENGRGRKRFQNPRQFLALIRTAFKAPWVGIILKEAFKDLRFPCPRTHDAMKIS